LGQCGGVKTEGALDEARGAIQNAICLRYNCRLVGCYSARRFSRRNSKMLLSASAGA
jgi:hypothetical protein